MILINGNWEIIRDLQDVSKIIREYYNDELADELDSLIPEHTDEDYYDLEFELADKLTEKDEEISNLDEEISDLKDEISDLKNEIEDLEVTISELENKISDIE